MAKISVVIPVYNVENYIVQCLESIINQTYTNFELLIVDDCGQDNSIGIAKDFLDKNEFTNYKIIQHEKNKGLGAARNTGIKNASTDYIMFIDSDDWIDTKTLEKSYSLIIEKKADVVCFGTLRMYPDYEEKEKGVTKITEFKDKNKSIISLLKYTGLTDTAWGKLYKKSLFTLNNIEYPTGMLFEDILTTIRVFDYTNLIVAIPDYYYFYRQQRPNAIFSKINKKFIDDTFKVNNMIFDYWVHTKRNLDSNFNFINIELLKRALHRISVTKDLNDDEKKEYILNAIKSYEHQFPFKLNFKKRLYKKCVVNNWLNTKKSIKFARKIVK